MAKYILQKTLSALQINSCFSVREEDEIYRYKTCIVDFIFRGIRIILTFFFFFFIGLQNQ